MDIYLISGNGTGAGKTTLARKLVREFDIWSIAGALRHELKNLYPNYNWYSKEQAYKEKTIVHEYGPTASVRQILIEYGNAKSDPDPTYWVRKLVDRLNGLRLVSGVNRIAIDDVRRVEELEYLKEKFPMAHHWHVVCPDAGFEPHFAEDSSILLDRADYVMTRWKS